MTHTEYSWLSDEELLAVTLLADDQHPLVVELAQRFANAIDYADSLDEGEYKEHGYDPRRQGQIPS